ncbi:hypothetical protein R6Q57_023900 [Mikania cordata]
MVQRLRYFFKPESNSTLRSHLTKHCAVVKNNPTNDQAQMSTECGVWNFDPDMVREMMRNLSMFSENLICRQNLQPKSSESPAEQACCGRQPCYRHLLPSDSAEYNSAVIQSTTTLL